MSVRQDGLIKVIRGERFTPLGLARKLKARVILESSSFKKGRERYSILMPREAFRVTQEGSEIFLHRDGGKENISKGRRDILDVLLYFASQHPPLHQDLPMPAGGIGYLTYEFAACCDTIRFREKADPLELPDAEFIFGHVFIIFDHYTDMLYLAALNYSEHEIDLERAVREVEDRINDLDFNYLAQDTRTYPGRILDPDAGRGEFMKGVSRVKREIIEGNLLQGVLSRRLSIQTEMPAMEAYKHLRSVNPSPYLFYIDFGGYQLFGSSPEVHVKVKEEKAVLRPIAGTRRRGKTAEEDKLLEYELLGDEKERAEHLMLVDLARNDLGRISRPGTVTVREYMGIEYYSHVMHIVSEVEGELAEGKNGADAIRATFPAGTVSGAPKIRAIETIDALEKDPRRFYAGLVGYVEPGGSMDTCITIRSALKKNDVIILQAGAGIVLDSTAEREFEETGEKLRALASAVGVEV
ncbi:MAG: anthranilate synthase component I [Spirochaetales bacterium]|nr:MAG: anthranilate synthase component I [Spirochaetales bacterium]